MTSSAWHGKQYAASSAGAEILAYETHRGAHRRTLQIRIIIFCDLTVGRDIARIALADANPVIRRLVRVVEINAPVAANKIVMSNNENTHGLENSKAEADGARDRRTGSYSGTDGDRRRPRIPASRTCSGSRFGTHGGKSNHPRIR